jgi:hypothetical protein
MTVLLGMVTGSLGAAKPICLEFRRVWRPTDVSENQNREGSRLKAKKHGGVFTHVTIQQSYIKYDYETPKDGPGKCYCT